MEPEHTLLEKEKHLQTTNCWVPCEIFGGIDCSKSLWDEKLLLKLEL